MKPQASVSPPRPTPGLGRKLVYGFGAVLRWTVLPVLALYFVTSITDISHIPIAELTLNMLFDPLFRIAAFIGILAWAFRDGEKSYEAWGYLGIGGIVLLLWLQRK